MTNTQVQHFSLDFDDLHANFIKIHVGSKNEWMPKIKELMEGLVSIYPDLKVSKWINFKDEPNIIARAIMISPETPSEIFFVAIREGEDSYDIFFKTKYHNQITGPKKNK